MGRRMWRSKVCMCVCFAGDDFTLGGLWPYVYINRCSCVPPDDFVTIEF